MDQIGATGGITTLIHFLFLPTNMQDNPPPTGSGEWRIACMPNMVEMGQTNHHPHQRATNETRAVTCPMCKKTDIFKQARQALEAGLRRGTREKA